MGNDTTDYSLKAEIERETGESDVVIVGSTQFKANILTGSAPFDWFIDGNEINGFLGNSFDGENPQIEVLGHGHLVFQTKLNPDERLFFKAEATLDGNANLLWRSEGSDGRSRFRAEDSLLVFYTDRSAGSSDWQRVEIVTENTIDTEPYILDWVVYSMQVTKWRSK